MTSTIQSPYTDRQISVWLRGLLTIAWADGHFDQEEQDIIAALMHQTPSSQDESEAFKPVSPAELAEALGQDSETANNFLRMAVMVAIADGVYSFCEDEVLFQYCQALGLNAEVLQALRTPLDTPPVTESSAVSSASSLAQPAQSQAILAHHHNVLQPVRDWLDQMDIEDPRIAHFLCKIIPSQCPFERDINIFGRRIAHIPALCKLNPLYEQMVGLRFRALSYLADDCGEDVSLYC